MTILGAVLAGGQSRRFGGDKAVANWRGVPLTAHVLAAIRSHVDAIVVCGRDWPGLIAISDRPSPGLGPLGGLCAALHHARTHGHDRVLSVPCDTPALPAGLLRELAACDGPTIVANLPVAGLWPAAFADALAAHLTSGGDRSVRAWATIAAARAISAAPTPNVNCRSDLDALDG